MKADCSEMSALDIYHVTARGSGKQFIFEDDTDRAAYMDLLVRMSLRHDAELLVHAFVENHVHLLWHVGFEHLSPMMRTIQGTYARSFNRKHGRSGHLFEGPFHREPVNDEVYLLECTRYIHQNAVRAGLPGGLLYPWSSYSRYLEGEGSPLIMGLFDSVEDFVRFHQASGRVWEHQRFDVPHGTTREAEKLVAYAREVLGDMDPSLVKGLPRAHRDEALTKLVAAELTLRQVELVTGVSRSTVDRVTRRCA